MHLITRATLDRLGMDARRYRPNLVIDTPDDREPFGENAWLGREFSVGEVRLRGTLPTPRCSGPTLEHGALPRDPRALRPLTELNRVDVEGFGVGRRGRSSGPRPRARALVVARPVGYL